MLLLLNLESFKGIFYLPRIFVKKADLTPRQVGGLINLLSNPKLSQRKEQKVC
jgi:uncharacterized membrane protein